MQEAKAVSAPAINLVDESFDIKKAGSYHLSMLLDCHPFGASDTSFSFAVLDTNTSKYLSLHSAPLKGTIDDSIFSPLGRGATWASVTCAVAHSKFTLVPSAIFDDEKKESFLGFNHVIEASEKIHADILNNIEARNLFTVSADFESMIRKYFINAHFIHNATSFIEGSLIQNKNDTGKKIFANFHSSYFEVVILDGRELLFSNAFNYKAPEDIAYYILFVYEQLHLNPEEIELVLSGEIEKTAEEHTLLYNYIRHIKFASRSDSFKYSYKFDEIQPHRFISLFNQYLCG